MMARVKSVYFKEKHMLTENNKIDDNLNKMPYDNLPNKESTIERFYSLETENQHLKRLYESVCLENKILQEVLEGKL